MTENTGIEISSLVGKRLLSGVDTSTEKVKAEWGDGYEDCNVLRFCLDGVNYVAIEDPSDGYRSSMRDVRVSAEPINNTFEPVEVIGSIDPAREDVLAFRDAANGKIVLEVGTDNSDGYYPFFAG